MRKLLLAVSLLFLGSTAFAQLPDVYAGAGLSWARLHDVFGTTNDLGAGTHYNLDNAAWKAYVGVKPLPFLGVEADYLDLGQQARSFFSPGSTEHIHADAHAFSAFAVGFLPVPLPFVDLFAKAGLARWDLSADSTSSFFDLDRHGTSFAFGGGARARLGHLGFRLEYEQFRVPSTDGAKTVTLGVSYHFL